jgi:protein-tyrosine-phosphatase
VCCTAAQTATIKDNSGKCQITVPSGGMALPGLYQAVDKSLTANVEWDNSGEYAKKLTDAQLKEFHFVKAFENTDARLLAEKEPTASTKKDNSRVWHVYVRVPGGVVCHSGITFKAPATEDSARKVALSLGPAK